MDSSRPLRAGSAFDGDEGWWNAKVTGRSGASSRAEAVRVIGSAANRSGFGAGYVQVSNRGVQIDLTGVADDVGVQSADPGAGGG